MTDILLEVCVDDVAGLRAAWEGDADRIELCSALPLGGLTPSAGLMAKAGGSPVPAYAMIRPRAGDFIYDRPELDVMRRDIDAARAAGLAGVVFGVNRTDGRLDAEGLAMLASHATGLKLTLHRAFDLVPDIAEAVDIAVSLGFERILTSGRARSAVEGIDDLVLAIAAAAGRISIMPGAGVNLETVDQLLSRLPVAEIHSSCSSPAPAANRKLVSLGFVANAARRTDASMVRALKARLVSVKVP